MKKVMLIALVLGLVTPVAAQTSNTGSPAAGECKLKLAQAPVIRGIRLGMTAKEVLAVFPGSENDETLRDRMSHAQFGIVTADIVPSYSKLSDKFPGVRSINLGFLDGELNFYSVMYNGPHWDTDEDFASRVSETLGLPGVATWKRPQHGIGKALTCDGFEVAVQRATASSGNSISVRNIEKDADQIGRARQEAVKNEARRAFKP
jgi:hypothetical protein